MWMEMTGRVGDGVGDGNGVDGVEGEFGVGEGRGEDGDETFEMGTTGDLGNDAAEAGVKRFGGGDGGGEFAEAVGDDRGGGLIAGGFKSQEHQRECVNEVLAQVWQACRRNAQNAKQ